MLIPCAIRIIWVLYLEALERLIVFHCTHHTRNFILVLRINHTGPNPWCRRRIARMSCLFSILIAVPRTWFNGTSVNQGSRVRTTFQLRPCRRTAERTFCLPTRPPPTVVYLAALRFLSPVTALLCLAGSSTGFGRSSRLSSGARGRHSSPTRTLLHVQVPMQTAIYAVVRQRLQQHKTSSLAMPICHTADARASIPFPGFSFYLLPACVCFLSDLSHRKFRCWESSTLMHS